MLRNTFCLAVTAAGTWGVYRLLRSAFDDSFATGVGAFVAVTFVVFSYAIIVDRKAPH